MNDRNGRSDAGYWEYCTIEWIWDRNQIAIYYGDQAADTLPGSYAEVVKVLNQLGAQRWEVATCAAAGNWLFWTLKRALK